MSTYDFLSRASELSKHLPKVPESAPSSIMSPDDMRRVREFVLPAQQPTGSEAFYDYIDKGHGASSASLFGRPVGSYVGRVRDFLPKGVPGTLRGASAQERADALQHYTDFTTSPAAAYRHQLNKLTDTPTVARASDAWYSREGVGMTATEFNTAHNAVFEPWAKAHRLDTLPPDQQMRLLRQFPAALADANPEAGAAMPGITTLLGNSQADPRKDYARLGAPVLMVGQAAQLQLDKAKVRAMGALVKSPTAMAAAWQSGGLSKLVPSMGTAAELDATTSHYADAIRPGLSSAIGEAKSVLPTVKQRLQIGSQLADRFRGSIRALTKKDNSIDR